jgi:hypothetical protein
MGIIRKRENILIGTKVIFKKMKLGLFWRARICHIPAL